MPILPSSLTSGGRRRVRVGPVHALHGDRHASQDSLYCGKTRVSTARACPGALTGADGSLSSTRKRKCPRRAAPGGDARSPTPARVRSGGAGGAAGEGPARPRPRTPFSPPAAARVTAQLRRQDPTCVPNTLPTENSDAPREPGLRFQVTAPRRTRTRRRDLLGEPFRPPAA